MHNEFGVPMEPEPIEPIATDWRGGSIYEGEYVYVTPDDEYVAENELDDWIEYTFGGAFQLHKSDL